MPVIKILNLRFGKTTKDFQETKIIIYWYFEPDTKKEM